MLVCKKKEKIFALGSLFFFSCSILWMSDSSTAVEVSNAQRGERILAASREEGEHTDFGNDKWKGTGPLSD